MVQLKTESRLCLVAAIFLLSGIMGCAGTQPTQPNQPHPGPYPSTVETLRGTAPLLVAELGKLPEILDGISHIESNALAKIASIYASDPVVFNHAFQVMYRVGNPGVRKYCTLVQALFWYALDHDTRQISAYLELYAGEVMDPNYPFLETITVSLLVSDIWDFNDRTRWGDPKAVIERLNAPELFEYWFSMAFAYDFSKRYKRPPVMAESAEFSIKYRKGVCYDAANLARVCLLRAGYKATGLNVVFSPAQGRTRAHSVCVMEIETQEGTRFIKVGDTKYIGAMGIPHESIKDVARKIAAGYGSHLSRYTLGFPRFDSFH